MPLSSVNRSFGSSAVSLIPISRCTSVPPTSRGSFSLGWRALLPHSLNSLLILVRSYLGKSVVMLVIPWQIRSWTLPSSVFPRAILYRPYSVLILPPPTTDKLEGRSVRTLIPTSSAILPFIKCCDAPLS